MKKPKRISETNGEKYTIPSSPQVAVLFAILTLFVLFSKDYTNN